MAFNANDPALLQRYTELHDIDDWKSLPRDEVGKLAFGIREFWRTRAERLGVNTVEDLLRLTPAAGRHTLEGTPANARLNGGQNA